MHGFTHEQGGHMVADELLLHVVEVVPLVLVLPEILGVRDGDDLFGIELARGGGGTGREDKSFDARAGSWNFRSAVPENFIIVPTM